MSITNFKREIWAADIQQSFLKSTKFSSPAVVNRQYEGEVKQGGTVHITSISRPTISAYTPGTSTLTYEALVDAGRILATDQIKEFSFYVEDVDKAQSANGAALMTEATREAGAGLAEDADTYVQTIMEADVDAGNKIGATSITTSELAIARMVAHKQLLDDDNVPQEGRYTIVPSWFHSLLILDARMVNYDAHTSGDMLRNGIVGRCLGFDVIQANYPLSTGDDWYVYSGHPSAVTFGDLIDEVEALRLQNVFGDAVRGLHVYGAKVTRPSGLCMTLCSVT